MTNTYTQDEAVRDILRITLDSSIRPLSQTHGDQVREILDQIITTTRRETVEGIAQIMAQTFDEMGVVSDEKVIADSYLRKLDQLPDKQEV